MEGTSLIKIDDYDQLCVAVKKVITVLRHLTILQQEVENAKFIIDQNRKDEDQVSKELNHMKQPQRPPIVRTVLFGLLTGLLFFVFSKLYIASEGVLWGYFAIGGPILFIFLIIAAWINWINNIPNKTRIQVLEDKLSSIQRDKLVFEERLNKSQNSLKEYALANRDLILAVPKKYCYVEALTYMSEVLSTGRARDFGTAASLYEEQLHRWKMEEMAAKTMEASIQTAQNAAATAESARAAARNTQITAGIEVYRLLSGR